jgi:hypothetical protein
MPVLHAVVSTIEGELWIRERANGGSEIRISRSAELDDALPTNYSAGTTKASRTSDHRVVAKSRPTVEGHRPGPRGAVAFAVVAFERRDCRHENPPPAPSFPPEVIVLAVRWYLRLGLSYRDVEELLTKRVRRGHQR